MAYCFSYGTNNLLQIPCCVHRHPSWATSVMTGVTNPWAGGLNSAGFCVNLQTEETGMLFLQGQEIVA